MVNSVGDRETSVWPESVIATHSGLRGRPGHGLTTAVVRRAVAGFSALLHELQREPSVGVGRDGRPGSLQFAGEVIGIASELGLDVVDFGAVLTPTAKLASRARGLGGAMMVTASHLADEWNGLKLSVGPDFRPVDIRALPEAAEVERPAPGRVRTDGGATRGHAGAIVESVDADLIRRAGLRVRASGGVGGLAELVLDALGCLRDGPGPGIELLLDADGDRLGLVDERGALLDPEAVLPLVALARGDVSTVVKGADTSRMVDDVIAARGGSVHVVVPGELHLLERVAETGAGLAGEGNGGAVIPAVGMARDAVAAAATVLELLASSGRSLSAHVAELPRYERRRSTVPCHDAREASHALSALAVRLGVTAPGDPEAGVYLEDGSGGWGLVRRSATEPVLRITAEAQTAETADRIHAQLVGGVVGGGGL